MRGLIQVNTCIMSAEFNLSCHERRAVRDWLGSPFCVCWEVPTCAWSAFGAFPSAVQCSGLASGVMSIFRHFGKRYSVLLPHGPPTPFPTPPLPDLHTDLANSPIINDPHVGNYSFCRNVGISYCSTWHIPEDRSDALETSCIVNKMELCGMARRSDGIITRYRSIQICHSTQSVTGDSSVLSLQRVSSTGTTVELAEEITLKFYILLCTML